MVVSKTTDIGETWTHYELTDTTGVAYAVSVDPFNSNVVYAGGSCIGNPALFKTTDGGANWIDASSGLYGIVTALAINPDSTHILYAGTSDGIFKSTDSGTNWIQRCWPGTTCLLIDPYASNTIFAGTRTNGICMSTNGGDDWQEFNEGLDTTAITCLDIHPGLYLYTGTCGSGLYRRDYIVGVEETEQVSYQSTIFYVIPNPTRGRATISYTLTDSKPVEISIYDVHGRLVETLVDEIKPAGTYTMTWHGVDRRGKPVSSGVYFCKCAAGERESIKKLIVVR